MEFTVIDLPFAQMSEGEVDFGALIQLVIRWLAILLALYLFAMVFIRMSKLYKITRCPNCGGELKRANRTTGDRMLNTFSFTLLPVKRYRCYVCYWEGRAFDIKSRLKKSSTDVESETETHH